VRPRRLLLGLAFALLGAPAWAQPPPEPEPAKPDDVTVHAEKPGSDAASHILVSQRDLELRPRLRPGDLLEAVPGLFAVQHAGGGKANQYFLRGFDADHGTDVAFFVDGVPLNLPSHAHGQGYADFHFLIPELVVTLDASKGPYYAQYGDFATAGAVSLRLAESFDQSFASFQAGAYGVRRALVVASPKLGETWRTLLAVEGFKEDGPFVNPEHLRRFNAFGRVTHDLPAGKLTLTAMSHGSDWNGSGQIPARAVCGEGEAGAAPPSAYGQPCIDHFGSVDPSEGGSTQRHMGSIAYSVAGRHEDFQAMAYAVSSRFRLYSDFTFFARDPVNGDEIEQSDARFVVGADARYRNHQHLGRSTFSTTLGAQVRYDGIANSLYFAHQRERLAPQVDADVDETSLGVYAEEDVRLTKQLRFVAGLRAQRLDVQVDDHRSGTSGAASGFQALPKLMWIVSPVSGWDLFASFGRGYHSNDARGAVRQVSPARLMTPATGYEVGTRVTPLKGLSLSAAAFLLDLDSELVWLGDEGTTEASAKTRRYGVEVSARYHLSTWLYADLDATLAHASYTANAGNGAAVALAPTRTFTAGVGARPTFGHWTPFGSLRVKALADRPANEDGSLTAQGFVIVDANAGVRWRDVEFGLDVQNLLDASWREVNFATTTRLAYEPQPVTGIHYSPGWPRTIMGRATVYF